MARPQLSSDLWFSIYLASNDKSHLLQTLPQATYACVSDTKRHYLMVKAREEDDEDTSGTLLLDCSDDAQEHIIRRAAVVQMKRARAQYAIQVIASKDLAAYKQLLVEGLTVDYVLDAHGGTALFYCVKGNWVEGLEFLQSQGVTWPAADAYPRFISPILNPMTTLIGLARPEYEGRCVVDIATANYMIFPEFNPIYTAVLYHQLEALQYLIEHATPEYINTVATIAYPAIFWNTLKLPPGYCGSAATVFATNFREHLQLSIKIQIASGVCYTILEQELRRPDIKASFIKILLDLPQSRTEEEERRYAEKVLEILDIKNKATQILVKDGDAGLKENSKLLGKRGWIGVNASEETLNELKQATKEIEARFDKYL